MKEPFKEWIKHGWGYKGEKWGCVCFLGIFSILGFAFLGMIGVGFMEIPWVRKLIAIPIGFAVLLSIIMGEKSGFVDGGGGGDGGD